MRCKAILKQALTGGRAQWAPEVAMRYLPVVKEIQRRHLATAVTEVGSGGMGIAPYLGQRVTGVDTDHSDGSSSLLRPLEGSVLDIPLPDTSCPAVVSVDMLEHIPPPVRREAVNELVRIAGSLLVLVFPEGSAAEQQDKELAARYVSLYPQGYRFFDEHLEYGLPRKTEVDSFLSEAIAAHGREAHVSWHGNSVLTRRRWLMLMWMSPSVMSSVLSIALTRFGRRIARVRGGATTYRKMAVVDFTSP